jgi:hypothetical protein
MDGLASKLTFTKPHVPRNIIFAETSRTHAALPRETASAPILTSIVTEEGGISDALR